MPGGKVTIGVRRMQDDLATPGISDEDSTKQVSAMSPDGGSPFGGSKVYRVKRPEGKTCNIMGTKDSRTNRPDASTLGGEKIARRQMTPPMTLEENHEHEPTHDLSIEPHSPPSKYIDRFPRSYNLTRFHPSPSSHELSKLPPSLLNSGDTIVQTLQSESQHARTFPTRAITSEICNNSLPHQCPWGSRCHRVHLAPPFGRLPNRRRFVPSPALKVDRDDFSRPLLIQNPNTSQESQSSMKAKSSPSPSPQDLRLRSPQDATPKPQHRQRVSETTQRPTPAETGHDSLIFTPSNDEPSSEKLIALEHPLFEDVKSCADVVFPHPPASTDRIPNDTLYNGYSDLCWDPQTGFWGWRGDDNAWADTSQSSDNSTSDFNVCSSDSTASSQSSMSYEDSLSTPSKTVRHPMPPSSDTCWNWLRGWCQRGYDCRFVHGDLDYDVQEQPTPTTSQSHVPNPRTCGDDVQSHPQDEKCLSLQHPHKPPLTSWSVTIHDHIKVKFGAGFDVQEVTTGFESPWVFMENIPSSMTLDGITQVLEPFGRVIDVKVPSRNNSSSMTVKARFSSAVEALQATAVLNGAQVFNSRISVRLPVNNTKSGNTIFHDTAVRVQWEAPGKAGYCGYPTIEQANKAISVASTPLRGSYVSASVHIGLPAIGMVTVRFRGLPLDTNTKDMEQFSHPEDVMWERPNYTCLDSAVSGIRRILEARGDLVSFEVLPPPYRDGLVRAWAHFSSPFNARAASDRLHGRKPLFTGRSRIFARHVQTLTYSLPHDAYDKIASATCDLRRSVWQRGRYSTVVTVLDRDPTSCVLVKLSGDDLKELGQVKSEFEKILRGETLRQDGKVAWDGFFSRPAGIAYLRGLELQNPAVSIQLDVTRRIVTLFGSSAKREAIRQILLSKIVELRSQRLYRIPLHGRLIGFFMSADLMALQRKFGPENVFLDLRDRALIIRGNRDAYQAAQETVHHAQQRHRHEPRPNVVDCPVCFNEVTSPMTLRCGHSWCRSCLSNYLIAATDNTLFPLTCLGSEARCSEPIPLSTAREILSPNDFQAVISASFSAHVHSRPDEFHYCPTPDCLQIYRTAPQDTVLQCPSCLLRICLNCHVEYHDGFECPDRDGGDKLFKEWVKNHDVKNCPGCKVPIERAEGCNHMTCIRCQTHICWVCLETFPRGQGIYGHMRAMHGGIGLGGGI